MEPVRRSIPLRYNRKTILLILAAVIAICIVSFFFWRHYVRQQTKPPVTVTEMDSRLMETGREEFLPLPSASMPPADGKLAEAQKALAARQPDKALQLADEILAGDARNYSAFMVKGRAYAGKGEAGKATEAFTKASEIKPDAPGPYLYRGHLHKASKRYEEALQQYTEALERNPDMTAAYYHRGDIYLLQEEYPDALTELSLAIVKQKGLANPLPTPYYKRGYLLYLMQEYKEAIRDLSRAIELAPEMYEGYLYRGNALTVLRRYDQALNDFNELIRLKPDFALGYYGRALVWREKGDPAKAETDFRKAEQLGVKRPQ